MTCYGSWEVKNKPSKTKRNNLTSEIENNIYVLKDSVERGKTVIDVFGY